MVIVFGVNFRILEVIRMQVALNSKNHSLHMILIGFSEANPFELNLPQKSSPKVNMKTVISKRTARNYKQKYTVIANEKITPQERILFQPAKPYKQRQVPPFSQNCHKS